MQYKMIMVKKMDMSELGECLKSIDIEAVKKIRNKYKQDMQLYLIESKLDLIKDRMNKISRKSEIPGYV